MRVVIAAPPKSGNSWVKCLLATIYNLRWLRRDDDPEQDDTSGFRTWAASGAFPDQSIFHKHYIYSDELVQAVKAVPAHLVTIIRDPYDAIVSLYFFIQTQAAEQGEPDRLEHRRTNPIVGKPIDHPDTIEYLDEHFREMLGRALPWVNSGHSVVVKYEELHHDPMAELVRATDAMQPVDSSVLTMAIAACEAQSMRQSVRGLRKRIRTATVGDWENHLSEAHLAVFRGRYADQIRALGYDVK